MKRSKINAALTIFGVIGKLHSWHSDLRYLGGMPSLPASCQVQRDLWHRRYCELWKLLWFPRQAWALAWSLCAGSKHPAYNVRVIFFQQGHHWTEYLKPGFYDWKHYAEHCMGCPGLLCVNCPLEEASVLRYFWYWDRHRTHPKSNGPVYCVLCNQDNRFSSVTACLVHRFSWNYVRSSNDDSRLFNSPPHGELWHPSHWQILLISFD